MYVVGPQWCKNARIHRSELMFWKLIILNSYNYLTIIKYVTHAGWYTDSWYIHVCNSILTHNPLYCTRYVKVVAHWFDLIKNLYKHTSSPRKLFNYCKSPTLSSFTQFAARKLFPILLLTARLVWAFRLCCLQWAKLTSVIHLQTSLDRSTYWQVLTGVLTDRFRKVKKTKRIIMK